MAPFTIDSPNAAFPPALWWSKTSSALVVKGVCSLKFVFPHPQFCVLRPINIFSLFILYFPQKCSVIVS